MHYFYISSSELAKLTGHNQYISNEQRVNLFLTKFKIKDVYIPSTNVEEGLKLLTPSQLSILNDELYYLFKTKAWGFPFRISPHLYSSLESIIRNNIIKPSQNSELTEEESKILFSNTVMNNGVLETLQSYIEKDLRMRRGNLRESTNLDVLQEKEQIHIGQRNSRMYSKELLRTSKYCLVLRGKVDGISGDTIIETKNRRNHLFMELREYEKVQLESYMYLTGLHKSILTEHYNSTSNQIYYNHSDVFWKLCLDEIIKFMDTYIVPHIE